MQTVTRHPYPALILASLSITFCACSNNGNSATPDTSGPADQGNPEAETPPDLPASFTDHVPRIRLIDSYDATTDTYEYTEHDEGPVAFEMILIPGDEVRGIETFYMGQTEVTWEMFEDWMYCRDITPEECEELMRQDLRPSPLYGNFEPVHMGFGERPAIDMSWRTAHAYCLWLSVKTGRTYRLPTDEEWLYVLERSGGIPEDRETLLAQAVVLDNAPFIEDRIWAEGTTPVASLAPNALGLHDLLGNAAEWVQPTEEGAWVRGGHFQLPADELTADWRAIEDQEVWNATYPNHPVSRFWYLDHYYQGLRLVCEAPR